jgi:hypothetical protein
MLNSCLESGKVVEHFSWKKVTINVYWFILGCPTIDHHGNMIVRDSFLIFLLLTTKFDCMSRTTALATNGC